MSNNTNNHHESNSNSNNSSNKTDTSSNTHDNIVGRGTVGFQKCTSHISSGPCGFELLYAYMSLEERWFPMELLYCSVFPGHALHEKGSQRQIGVGTLASSQERRSAVVPRINRLSTDYQPRVNRGFCSSIVLHWISLVRASRDTVRAGCLLTCPEKTCP